MADERWRFVCTNCSYAWDEEFVVRTADDGHGGACVTYWRNGVQLMSPWTEVLCQECHRSGVRAIARPAAREPARERGARAGRRPRSRRP